MGRRASTQTGKIFHVRVPAVRMRPQPLSSASSDATAFGQQLRRTLPLLALPRRGGGARECQQDEMNATSHTPENAMRRCASSRALESTQQKHHKLNRPNMTSPARECHDALRISRAFESAQQKQQKLNGPSFPQLHPWDARLQQKRQELDGPSFPQLHLGGARHSGNNRN